MKKSVLLGIGALAAASLLAGCADEWGPSRSGSGRISPVVGIDTEALTTTASSRAEGDLTADDLSLRLSKTDGSYANTWDRLADFPLDAEFGVGEYLLEAFYGDAAEEGYDKPYYHGEALLTVADGKTTTLAFTAGLANSMISIDYTDAFKKYMADWSATVKGTGEHAYAKDETRPVYVTSGPVEVAISFTKPNGLTATTTLPKLTAEPRHHYVLTVNVNDGGVGDAALEITFPDELGLETIDIDLSDKLLATEPPVVDADGFTSGEGIEMVAGIPAEGNYAVTAVAQAQLQAVTLTTTSPSLIKQGWPEEIDLLSATADMQAKLQALGLKALGLWHNPDMMAVIDFTGVLGNLKVDAQTDNVNTFSIVVKDKLGRESEPVDFVVNVESVNLSLASADEYYIPGESLKARLSFNGSQPAENIHFSYSFAVSGTDKPLEVESVETVSSRGMSDYIVSFVPPTLEDDITLKAECGGVVNTVKIPRIPFDFAIAENDVYSNHAYAKVTVRAGAEGLDGTPEILASTDGGNTFAPVSAALENDYYHITWLTPNTAYTFRARIGDIKSCAVERTTEAELQLKNGNLDADVKYDGSASNWENVVFEGWGTNNAMTTSQGSNYAYTRISGTKQTNDSHSGKAAVISTQGWGSGNTAAGSIGAMKYADCGLLHLGSTRTERPAAYSGVAGPLTTDDLACGIEFASRPSSVSFWYKYAPKNSSDHGVAIVRVYDSVGNTIAEGSLNLSKADAYKEVSIPLTYRPGISQKASGIYICFLSTGVQNALQKNSSWMNFPNFGNLSRGEYYGSRLYIDDIQLNY